MNYGYPPHLLLSNKESSVHRNPYEGHDAYDAIRTQDADLAVSSCILYINVHRLANSCEVSMTSLNIGNIRCGA